MSNEVKVLEARRAASNEVVRKLESSAPPDDAGVVDKVIHTQIVMACHQAAGLGFDAGVKFFASEYEEDAKGMMGGKGA